MKTSLLTFMALMILALNPHAQKFENLALTPPMGWNSWNKFQCEINEDMIRQMADAMVETGMRDAGYEYIVIDDCWHAQRDSLGFIQADPDRFPSGMKALADYIHAKGLKFGIYSDAGNTTCAGYPGSRGHEYQDAKTYASWGIDYLKYDWCDTEGLTGIGAYTTMSQALKEAGRPIVFSLCDWGHNKPWEWAREVGHLWRTTGDIYNCWDCEHSHGDWSSWGILKILDMHREFNIRKYQGPGHYNDPDMLQVGNGMSVNEDRGHFSIWAMLSAPLISGNDLRNMTEETLEILTNDEVIAVNQDKLAIQAFRYLVDGDLEIWFKPLSENQWAVMFLNRGDAAIDVSFDWKDHVITDEVFNRQVDFSKSTHSIRDVWAKKDQGTTSKKLSIGIPGRDVWMATLLSCQSQAKEEAPKSSSQVLFENLQSMAGEATLFGHQDDLAYGIGWKYVEGESDVKRLAGDYPALFGWELGGIELGHAVNLDQVPFDTMRELALWAHKNGAVNTFSWHPYSAVDSTKSSWETDEVVVRHILPGGSHHEVFLDHLDKVVAFFKALKTGEGEAIPFIFRPWHEMDGSWFWWGASLTTPEELKALFRFSIEYLHKNGVTNFLTAYSPDRHFNSQEEYLTWYPGDDLVDIIGVDNYYDLSQGATGLQAAIQKLEIVAKYADQTGKVAAFTETGLDGIGDENWYTETLGALINASEWTRKTTYAMVWRNHDLSHFYVPHTGHPAAEDFKAFVKQENIWLLKDWSAYTTDKE